MFIIGVYLVSRLHSQLSYFIDLLLYHHLDILEPNPLPKILHCGFRIHRPLFIYIAGSLIFERRNFLW